MPDHLAPAFSACASPTSAGALGALPCGDATAASSRFAPAARAGFPSLPAYLIEYLADKLDNSATIALSETSKHAHRALDADWAAPIRLREQAQWVRSHTAFLRIARRLETPSRWRSQLREVMEVQSWSLHPVLRERARAALPVRPRAPAPQEAPPRPTLDHVMGLADARRGPSLVAWLAGADRAEIMAVAPLAWLGVIGRLPPADRTPVRAKLTTRWPDQPVQTWYRVMLTTLQAAHQLENDPDPDAQRQRAQLLKAIARALTKPYHENAASLIARVVLWCGVLKTTPSLPAPHRKDVMVRLAMGALRWCEADFDFDEATFPMTERWPRLIRCALEHLSPADAAEVLRKMLDYVDAHIDWIPYMPLVVDAVAAVDALPSQLAISVLEAALYAADCYVDTYVDIWDRMFRASSDADCARQADLLAKLGGQINHLGEAMESRFIAFCERVATLPAALRHIPLLSLYCLHDVGFPAGTAVPRLMALMDDLNNEHRARLLGKMLDQFGTDLRWRRVMLNAAADLPMAYHYTALAGVAQELLDFAHGHEVPARKAWPEPEPGPRDHDIAFWPGSREAARRQVSQIMDNLTVKHRGDLLMCAVQLAKCADDLLWVLDELSNLRRTQRHEVVIVTSIAEFAAKKCTAEEAPRLLPRLAAAISTMDADHCASAFYWLAQACETFGMPACVELANTAHRLPEADRIAPAGGNKRKATTEALGT